MSRPTPRRPPRNWLAQREQRKLLLVLGAFGLVIFLMSEARKPANWYWLWGGAPQQVDTSLEQFKKRDRDIDTVVPLKRDDGLSVAGAVVIEKDAAQAPQQTSPAGDAVAPSDDVPDSRVEYYPGVRTDLLGEVRDGTTWHYSSEPQAADHQLWFNLFDLLNRSDEEALRQSNPLEVTFAQLYRQPRTHRGRLIHFKGQVRRAEWWKAPENEEGLTGYWRLWIAFNGQTTVVYALELPEGFPTGNDISAPVDVVGFFYKLRAYTFPSEDSEGHSITALNVAPMILARTVRWTPPAAPQQAQPVALWIWIVGVAACAALAVAISVGVWRRSLSTGAEALVRKRDASLAGLERENIPSVAESLQELERKS